MNKAGIRLFLAVLGSAFFIFFMREGYAQVKPRPRLLAHFMPWHQTPDVSGYWGYHWTMNHFNPDKIDANGRREIASHYYPLTGPYDSLDKDILEYQVLLMKLSGIDGVLVDWYGMEDFWDYGVLNESTQALFEAVVKADLTFAIVYEDQTVMHMVDNNHIKKEDALAHGIKVMQYLQDNWFSTNTYFKIDNRPLLLTFGPQYFKNSSDWSTMFADLPIAPLFFTLDNPLSPVTTGAYPWPPMWKSNASGILTQTALNAYLTQFYQKASAWPILVTSAFPGFNDIYKEAGAGAGYGFLDAQNGATFRSTLQLAVDKKADVIQLVTWNDYGEGTIIEPTEEFGYRYLEMIQDIRKTSYDSLFPFRAQDLRMPKRILDMRRDYANNADVNAALDKVFSYLIAQDIYHAESLLNKLPSLVGSATESVPLTFTTVSNYPNPFNSSTTFAYTVSQPDFVQLAVCTLNGRMVQLLLSEPQLAGAHSVNWQSGDAASGVYIYQLSVGGCSISRKCLLLR
jgi:hypothetical protein